MGAVACSHGSQALASLSYAGLPSCHPWIPASASEGSRSKYKPTLTDCLSPKPLSPQPSVCFTCYIRFPMEPEADFTERNKLASKCQPGRHEERRGVNEDDGNYFQASITEDVDLYMSLILFYFCPTLALATCLED